MSERRFAVSSDSNEQTNLAKDTTGKLGVSTIISSGQNLSTMTWNVEETNNNRFECLLTVYGDTEYNQSMELVEKSVEDLESEIDVPINTIFMGDMFDRLEMIMVENDVHWPSVWDY